MRRREFITLLGGAAAWPLTARAQQPDRIRHIGMLVAINDPDIKAFQQELEKHGWSEGHNIHIDYRVAPAGAQVQTLAKELVAMQPDVIFALWRPATAALQKETRTIPIVFTYVIDPIGAGFIASLAHPGGNLTGIMAYEPSVVGKWLGCSRRSHHRLHAWRFWEIRKLPSITITCCTGPRPPRRRSESRRSPAASRTMPPTSSAQSPPSPACQTAPWSCCRKHDHRQ